MRMENLFYTTLENVFLGADIIGEGGFVNLLNIKKEYYQNVIKQFKFEVTNDEIIKGDFKEEFFDKLYNFFKNYFNESGSVYFVKNDIKNPMRKNLFMDNKDVALFWKTADLYYVKSDILFKDADIKISDMNNKDYLFHFDVGKLKGKQNNVKKTLVYTFENMNLVDGIYMVVIKVAFSERNTVTNLEELAKKVTTDVDSLKTAIKSFEKQETVDFFINKNAKKFLEEQLDNYISNILNEDENIFVQERLSQIKCIKNYAKKLIAFISQFEMELSRIWNKPKFVKNSRYVFSLKTLRTLLDEKDYNYCIDLACQLYNNNKEYKEEMDHVIMSNNSLPLEKKYVYSINKNGDLLELQYLDDSNKKNKDKSVSESVNIQEVFDKNKFTKLNNPIKSEMKTISFNDVAYIDTSFLSEEDTLYILECLSKNNKIENIINGYIIKSDNYQFLNTSNKFKNEVDLIYVDPPFNTEGNYAFLDGFKDSTWLSMMYDRFYLLKNKFLNDESGDMYVHLDHHCNYYGRIILDDIFNGDANREIIWNTSPSVSGFKAKALNFIRQHDTILYYKSINSKFNKMYRNYKQEKVDGLGWLDVFHEGDKQYVLKYTDDGTFNKFYLDKFEDNAIGDVWNDVYSMMYTQNMTRENWNISNTQKPENLLRRIIQSSSDENDIVMDIYAGTGTTAAAAHKLNRKWIVTEFGDYVEGTVLMRMKTVISGDYRTKLSEDINWRGGGIFKYYELEQYEETLDNSIYLSNKNYLERDASELFNQYVFFNDKKLLGDLNVGEKKLTFTLNSIFNDIDLIETLSNITGLPVIKITREEFLLGKEKKNLSFKTNINKMNDSEKLELINLLKPYLWWGEE